MSEGEEARWKVLEASRADAKENGYGICPDAELLNDLVDGLAQNVERYGYGSCPCRLSSGVRTYDADIICPCEYRDADVDEFGMCYCGLFVSKEVLEDPGKMGPIPERRPTEAVDATIRAAARKERGLEDEVPKVDARPASAVVVHATVPVASASANPAIPVWRCKVCGYLCARETPPGVCPISL